jgi:DNA topoisomerase-3
VKQRQAKTKKKVAAGITSETCPKCKKGSILKGKSAYGCSAFKNGCDFVMPFENFGKKVSEKQFIRLLQKGSTVNLKGFTSETGTTEGLLRFDESFKLVLEAKKGKTKISEEQKSEQNSDVINCPKCNKGHIIKGKTAYGCSDYKAGCDFKMSFDAIREKAKDRKLTKDLVYAILKGES